MQFVAILLVAAVIFGLCYLVDKAFAKLFRSKAQHMSGLAVRAAKRYGLFGVLFTVLGILAVINGLADQSVLLWGGLVVLILGICLCVYYLSFGIFYDGETLLYTRLGKKSQTYRFGDIVGQKLYVIQGGATLVELHMADGKAISLLSTMDGVFPFLDTAFAAWCMQTGRNPGDCQFHDPSQSLWFPTVEDV